MEVEICVYPVGNSCGATLKTASGQIFIYLNGEDPLDALLGILHRCFSQSYRRAA
jgi:hypothetical protein